MLSARTAELPATERMVQVALRRALYDMQQGEPMLAVMTLQKALANDRLGDRATLQLYLSSVLFSLGLYHEVERVLNQLSSAQQSAAIVAHVGLYRARLALRQGHEAAFFSALKGIANVEDPVIKTGFESLSVLGQLAFGQLSDAQKQWSALPADHPQKALLHQAITAALFRAEPAAWPAWVLQATDFDGAFSPATVQLRQEVLKAWALMAQEALLNAARLPKSAPPEHPYAVELFQTRVAMALRQGQLDQAQALLAGAPPQTFPRLAWLESHLAVAEALTAAGQEQAAENIYLQIDQRIEPFRRALALGRSPDWLSVMTDHVKHFGADASSPLRFPAPLANGASGRAIPDAAQTLDPVANSDTVQWYVNDFFSLPLSQDALAQWLSLERMRESMRLGERQVPVLEAVLAERRALRASKASQVALADYRQRYAQLSQAIVEVDKQKTSGLANFGAMTWLDDQARDHGKAVERAQAHLARILQLDENFSAKARAEKILSRAQDRLQWQAYELGLERAPRFASSVKRSEAARLEIAARMKAIEKHLRTMTDVDALADRLKNLTADFQQVGASFEAAQAAQLQRVEALGQTYFSERLSQLDQVQAHTRFGLATLADRAWLAQGLAQTQAPPAALVERYEASLMSALSPQLQARVRYRLAELYFMEAQSAENQGAENQGAGRQATALVNFAPVLKQWQSLLADFPDHPDRAAILYRLAQVADLNGDRAAAHSALATLVAEYPDVTWHTDARFRLGEYDYAEGDYASAADNFSAVLGRPDGASLSDYALYMLGWSHFKLEAPSRAIDTFFTLLAQLEGQGLSDMSDNRLATDSLRALSIVFDEHGGVPTLVEKMNAFSQRNDNQAEGKGAEPITTALGWQRLVFEHLETFYRDKERMLDAVGVLEAFTQRYPDDPMALVYQFRKVDLLTEAGFLTEARDAKAVFVERYAPLGPYWQATTLENQTSARRLTNEYLFALARHAHSQAQESTQVQARESFYRKAIAFYKQFLALFPQDKFAAEQSYRLAICQDALGAYPEAIEAYQAAAAFDPPYEQAAVSAYGAVKAYEALWESEGLSAESRPQLREEQISYGVDFAERFPDHPEALAVQLQMASIRLSAEQWAEAEFQAETILISASQASARVKDSSLLLAAEEISATAAFEQRQFARAEAAFTAALRRLNAGVTGRIRFGEQHQSQWSDLLAQCIYQQGRLALEAGEPKVAIAHFQRLGKTLPNSRLREQADFDALTYQLSEQMWVPAISAIEDFQARFPDSPWQSALPAKLALAYEKTQRWALAAKAYSEVAHQTTDPELKRQAWWQVAMLYEKADEPEKSLKAYALYATSGQKPFDPWIESLSALARGYDKLGAIEQQRVWLHRLIEAHESAGDQQTDRSAYLAAEAQMFFASEALARFEAVRLDAPLQQSLASKRKRMQEAVGRLQQVQAYGIAPFATQAQYAMGSIYQHLAKSLMESARPKGLSALELEQYDILLEEQAFPFEEQAIVLHERNLENSWAGVYDQWVQKSIDALSQLMPVRYSRKEATLEYGQHVQ